jgi:hypothetical protein
VMLKLVTLCSSDLGPTEPLLFWYGARCGSARQPFRLTNPLRMRALEIVMGASRDIGDTNQQRLSPKSIA